jgi:hypothetical protein
MSQSRVVLEQLSISLDTRVLGSLYRKLQLLGYDSGVDGLEQYLFDFATEQVKQPTPADPISKVKDWAKNNPEKVDAIAQIGLSFLKRKP